MYTPRRRRRATAVLLVLALLVVPVGGAAGTAADETTTDEPTVEVALVPANATAAPAVAPGENRTVEVRVSGASEGVGSFGLDVRSGNVSVLTVVDGSVVVDAGLRRVRVSEDGSSASVSAAAVDVSASDANGSVTVARLRVRGGDPGTAELSLRGAQVGYADGSDDYAVATRNATVGVGDAAAGPTVVPGSPARDLDGDGTFEDVDGDGRLGVGDVVVLFANLDAPAVAERPAAFDFGGDGRVGVGDVVRLFRLL